MKIKLFQPYIGDAAKVNVQRVLNGTQIAQGPEVDLFEREFAAQFGFEPWQVVSLNSGTSALELAYDLAKVDQFSTVLTPLLTCTATNIPLVRRKANMSFIDVEGKNHLNMDPEMLEYQLEDRTNWPKKVVVFVHFGGSSAGLEEVEVLSGNHNADLICDAAQALGSRLSKVARFNAISLQAIKSLTAGDGGVLVCRDREDAQNARKLRWFGYDREIKQLRGDTDLSLAGYKMHMNDISAAIARGNLMEWKKIVEHRQGINHVYESHWSENAVKGSGRLVPGIWNPSVIGFDYHEAKMLSEDAGFEIGQHHYRNDKYSIFRSAYSNCPNMDEIGNNYFMLPCHMGMTLDDAHLIASTLWGN